MNDRLDDLKNNTSSRTAGEAGDAFDLEAAGEKKSRRIVSRVLKKKKHANSKKTKSVEPQELMDCFFHDIAAVGACIDVIKKATKRIGEINDEAFVTTIAHQETLLSQEFRSLIEKTNKQAMMAKKLLEKLDKENTNIQENDGVSSADLRIRMNLYSSLGQKFFGTMRSYQDAQQKYKTNLKDRVTRQILALKPDATEEEVHCVLESTDRTEHFLKSAFLSGVSDAIKIEYESVESKHQDILAIERSVAELHKLFLDFSFLTETQGEVLDHIELSVKNAREHVRAANKDLHKTIKIQRKIRKKHCLITLIIIVIVGVVVAVIFFA